jgi:hypothetical protein
MGLKPAGLFCQEPVLNVLRHFAASNNLLLIHVSAIRDLLVLPVVFLILLDPGHDACIGIRANDNPQWRILHDGKLIHRACAFPCISRLHPMPLVHVCLGIDMVVCRVPLCKVHGLAAPIGPESPGLDARELDPPLWLDLLADRFRKPLSRPLGRAVDTERRHASLAPNARHLLDQAAARRLLVYRLLAYRLYRLARHVDQAEVVDLHLLPDLLVGELFEATCEAVAGVVDDVVDAGELFEGGVEGGFDGRLAEVVLEKERDEGLRAVATQISSRSRTSYRSDLERQNAANNVLWLVRSIWLAQRPFPQSGLVSYLGVEFAEAGRGAGYEEDAGHVGTAAGVLSKRLVFSGYLNGSSGTIQWGPTSNRRREIKTETSDTRGCINMLMASSEARIHTSWAIERVHGPVKCGYVRVWRRLELPCRRSPSYGTAFPSFQALTVQMCQGYGIKMAGGRKMRKVSGGHVRLFGAAEGVAILVLPCKSAAHVPLLVSRRTRYQKLVIHLVRNPMIPCNVQKVLLNLLTL